MLGRAQTGPCAVPKRDCCQSKECLSDLPDPYIIMHLSFVLFFLTAFKSNTTPQHPKPNSKNSSSTHQQLAFPSYSNPAQISTNTTTPPKPSNMSGLTIKFPAPAPTTTGSRSQPAIKAETSPEPAIKAETSPAPAMPAADTRQMKGSGIVLRIPPAAARMSSKISQTTTFNDRSAAKFAAKFRRSLLPSSSRRRHHRRRANVPAGTKFSDVSAALFARKMSAALRLGDSRRRVRSRSLPVNRDARGLLHGRI